MGCSLGFFARITRVGGTVVFIVSGSIFRLGGRVRQMFPFFPPRIEFFLELLDRIIKCLRCLCPGRCRVESDVDVAFHPRQSDSCKYELKARIAIIGWELCIELPFRELGRSSKRQGERRQPYVNLPE